MKTEQNLKNKITPEFTKWISKNNNEFYFPLLIHRAVENLHIIIDHEEKRIYSFSLQKEYEFKNYQPKSLTLAECTILDCLLDIFEQENKNENK